MKKLAADRQVFVPAEVIDFLLVHTRRDLPSLIEALEQLHHRALAEKRRITLRLARTILEGTLPSQDRTEARQTS